MTPEDSDDTGLGDTRDGSEDVKKASGGPREETPPASPVSEYSEVGFDEEAGCVTINYNSKKLPGHVAHLKNYILENGSAFFEQPSQIYPDEDIPDPFGRFTKLVTELTHPRETYLPFLEVWWRFLELYTPRHLTYDCDRFLAMNGITSVAQRWTHLRNTFGLWFHFLVYELCWYVDPHSQWLYSQRTIQQTYRSRGVSD